VDASPSAAERFLIERTESTTELAQDRGQIAAHRAVLHDAEPTTPEHHLVSFAGPGIFGLVQALSQRAVLVSQPLQLGAAGIVLEHGAPLLEKLDRSKSRAREKVLLELTSTSESNGREDV
jgi:hypothetical protein